MLSSRCYPYFIDEETEAQKLKGYTALKLECAL